MRVLFAAALLLSSVTVLAAPDAEAAIPCHPLPEFGPGIPPSSITVHTDCIAHCPVLVQVDPDVYELHPECLGPGS